MDEQRGHIPADAALRHHVGLAGDLRGSAAAPMEMGVDFEHGIQRFINATPQVLDAVAAQLPAGFPDAVSGPIFEGILSQVRKLAQG